MKRIRAVLHAHSDWSYDGRWSLGRIARLYGALGVDAVMMSEHDTGFVPERFEEYRARCKEASTNRCTLVPGIEYSSPENDLHILTWGLDDFLAEHRPVFETLHKVKERNGVAVFAHPVRRDAWKHFQMEWVPLLSGIELWNRKSDGAMWGQEAWNLVKKTGLPPTVGQDFHKLKQLYPLTMSFKCDVSGTLEETLVRQITVGHWDPQAFRVNLLGKGGEPRKHPHHWIETLRRGILRKKRPKRSS